MHEVLVKCSVMWKLWRSCCPREWNWEVTFYWPTCKNPSLSYLVFPFTVEFAVTFSAASSSFDHKTPLCLCHPCLLSGKVPLLLITLGCHWRTVLFDLWMISQLTQWLWFQWKIVHWLELNTRAWLDYSCPLDPGPELLTTFLRFHLDWLDAHTFWWNVNMHLTHTACSCRNSLCSLSQSQF